MLKIAAFKRTIRKVLNIVAAHIEGLRHPPIYSFLIIEAVNKSCVKFAAF
jgi:hypothetical protein